MKSILLTILSVMALSLVSAQAETELERAIRMAEESSRKNQEIIEQLKQQTMAKKADQQAIAKDPAVIAAKFEQQDNRLSILENADDAAAVPLLQKNLNVVFIVICAILVFFMQAGFCCLEMGLARAKNSINVVMKNVLDLGAASVFYLLFGFALMFGASEGGFIGAHFWLPSLKADSQIWSFFFFQVVFAATACTIASGAMAERTKFVGYLVYTAIFAGLIYPIFGHWVWGGGASGLDPEFGGGGAGWLQAMGMIDFAGSTVVHGIGGACALAGIIVVGARKGRFSKNGEVTMIAGHNIPLAALGTLILWTGWFGFNAGSGLIGHAEIGRVVVNTLIAPSAGSIMAMTAFWVLRGSPDVTITLNGALGGLVGVTASCATVNPGSALIIGMVAGILATAGSIFLEKMKLDDVVGAVPVHLFCGMWGTIAVGLFHENGFSLARVGVQTFGTVAVCGAAFLVAFVIFKTIDVYIGLRADDEQQEDGLDFVEHATNAYPDFETAER